MTYSIAPGTTAEEQTMKRKLALALMTQGSDTSPVQHWTQGAARALQGALGGYEMYAADKADKDERASGNEMLAKFLAGGQQPAASPVASDTAAPAPANMAEPRGYRNNNPLNIEAGPFTQDQPGFQGSDGRFAKFASLDQGVGAAGKLLDVYEKKHGLNTVEGIVGRWAPAGDGNNVNAYAANVAKQLGIAPNEPVPPEMRERLIAAMAQHENGKPMPQMAQAAPQGPQQPNREMLIQMLGNRHTAPMAQSIIGAQISQQFKPETTDEIKEYNLYSKQEKAAGRAPLPFYDYKTGLKRAGAIQNSVQIDQKGESSFSTEAGKLQAKRFNDLAEDAPAAKQMLSDVEMLRDLGTKIQTGKGAEAKAIIGPFAEALGIKVDGLSEIQAFDAIINRVAPNLRVKGSGAQSDFELRNFLKSIPSLGNTPEGNEIAGRVLEGLSQNKIAAAEIGAKALNGEMTRSQAEKAIRDLPDPMKEWREFNKAAKKGAGPAQPPSGGGSLGGTTKNGLPWKVVQ